MKILNMGGKQLVWFLKRFCFLMIILWAELTYGQNIPLPSQEIPLPRGFSSQEEQSALERGLNLKFGGYLENTLNSEHLVFDDSINSLNNTKLRLNLNGKFSDLAGFGLSLIGETNIGERKYELTKYLPQDVEERIPLKYRSAFVDELDDKNVYFQEAFLTLSFSGACVRLGRFKFYAGTGYAYNPIDLFNQKDPLDPTYETNGQDAVMFCLGLSPSVELELTLRTDEDHNNLDNRTRLKYYINGWDLAFQYTRYTKARYDWTLDGQKIDFVWNLYGFEFSGELGQLGIHGEGGYVIIDKPCYLGSLTSADRDHERLLIGLDYTFEWQLYVLLEYMRFGQGVKDSNEMTLNHRMAYLTGEIITSNRDTLYMGLKYPLTDLLDASVYSIVNCNDPSVILSPWLEWDVQPGWKLTLVANLPLGSEDSCLGRMGASGFVRLRFSF